MYDKTHYNKKKKERKKKESELFNIGKDNVFFPVEFHLNNGKLKLKWT